jgi:signal transduction histidine kinase
MWPRRSRRRFPGRSRASGRAAAAAVSRSGCALARDALECLDARMALDLRSHRFISHFRAAQGTQLVKLVKPVRFPHRAVIFEENAVSDCIYLVLTGRVALSKRTPGGSAQVIAYKGPDDYFGELGVLDGSRRSTAAVADGPVQLGRIDQKPFLKILAESSWHTVLRLFSHVSENLRATNERYVTEIVRKEKMTLIGEMANAMIHDFRSPFTAIQLATELIGRRHDDPKTREICLMIQRQVDRLGGMVEEVLEFARGETRLVRKSTPLRDVFTRLQENNAAAFARSNVRLVVRPTSLVVPLDPERFLRVLQNLVTNAFEAISTPRRRGHVVVSARRQQNNCVITVADDGPGVPKEIRSTLFEPFVSFGKSGGTGLGLAIARSVVEAHRGTIDYRTSRRGTTFTLQLALEP